MVRLTADAPVPLPHGAVKLGALKPSTKIHLDVTLNVRDQAALNAFVSGVTDQHSPLFGKFLRPGQFGPRFGATRSSVAAVRAALQRAGLSPGAVTSDRLAIPVSATAAAIEHAFRISLVRYRLPGGRVAFANASAPKIPAAVAPYVAGILGLDDLYPQQRMLARPSSAPARGHRALARPLTGQADAAGPKPCAAASAAGASSGSYTDNLLAEYYLMTPLYSMGDLGQGIRIGVFELEPNLPSDINSFKNCYNVHTTVTYTKVDGGAGSGPGQGEAALDIENIIGLAPDAAIDVYQGPPTTAAATYDTYHAIIKADRDQVISTSWGGCDLYTSNSFANSEETLFEEAYTQGQTIFAAAGDSGSTGCFRLGGPDKSKLSAGNPASDPLVNGVGGTGITQNGEVVWNESARNGGAGTGGLSSIWCMPSYQYKTKIPGLISSHSKTNSGCASAKDGDHIRQEPDLSADADPYSGYVIILGGTWMGGNGGTSAAAPLWAAVAALIDASPFCAAYHSGHPGVLPGGLYAMVSRYRVYLYPPAGYIEEGLTDITKGNNDYTPDGYTGGLYPATRGYDMATGLGSPLVGGINGKLQPSIFYPGIAGLMCQWFATRLKTVKITHITPNHGSVNGGTKVTITGSGFMPIKGTDMILVGKTLKPATCLTSTKCTAVMPKHSAGTVDIYLLAEDFPSAKTSADRFTYRG